jgi:hypothetical protein
LPGDRPPQTFHASVEETATATDVVDAAVVSLDSVAAMEGLSVADQVTLRTQDLREWMADRVVPAFLWANGLTLAAIGLLVVLDEINIGLHLIAPGERIIGGQVIMSLLGATTVQVGAIAYLIARHLFPGRSA